jgi:predicted GIY-YIG superfamily endonuclease
VYPVSTVGRRQRIISQDNIGNKYIPNYSYKAWEQEEKKDGAFYVYILNFDNGSYYIGHTRELRERILEIRNDDSISKFGKEPKLQYFEIHPNRQAAMIREAEIKEIYKNNHHEISRMISSFVELLKELDFD